MKKILHFLIILFVLGICLIIINQLHNKSYKSDLKSEIEKFKTKNSEQLNLIFNIDNSCLKTPQPVTCNKWAVNQQVLKEIDHGNIKDLYFIRLYESEKEKWILSLDTNEETGGITADIDFHPPVERVVRLLKGEISEPVEADIALLKKDYIVFPYLNKQGFVGGIVAKLE